MMIAGVSPAESCEWAFEYEGPFAGLSASLDRYQARVDGACMTQFKCAAALVISQAQMAHERGESFRVDARGFSGPDGRGLHVHVHASTTK